MPPLDREPMTSPSRMQYSTAGSLSDLVDQVTLTRPPIAEVPSAPGADLRRAIGTIEAADPAVMCRQSAQVMEQIADRLSWTAGMSIVRRRGDGSLGDRWPGVANALRKTDADDESEQVTRSPLFRSLVAAPHDHARATVSTAEARRFGEAVLSLLDRMNCADCGEWWTATSAGASRWTCRCRALVVVSRPHTR